MGQDLLIIEASRSHSGTLQSGRAISPTQIPLPDNTQLALEREKTMPPAAIRTYNPSKRAPAEPRLKPRSHWDLYLGILTLNNTGIK
jgi:hypothetical protein